MFPVSLAISSHEGPSQQFYSLHAFCSISLCLNPFRLTPKCVAENVFLPGVRRVIVLVSDDDGESVGSGHRRVARVRHDNRHLEDFLLFSVEPAFRPNLRRTHVVLT